MVESGRDSDTYWTCQETLDGPAVYVQDFPEIGTTVSNPNIIEVKFQIFFMDILKSMIFLKSF